ncbi:MAG: ion transporter [Alphaproteobacteria bacterium]|nr:ion transporter [Alphaproteobacteria bacterium]
MSARRRVFLLLDNRPGGRASRTVALALQVLIGANVLAVILESVASVGERYRDAFALLEVTSMVLFTLEYAARLWAAPEERRRDGQPRFPDSVAGRLRYALTPLALIDLATLVPFYLSALVGADLRWLRVLRMVGLLKCTRYSQALVTAADVARAEAAGLVAAVTVFAVTAVLAAAGMYAFEHTAQPDTFAHIPLALYWSIVTLTTLGYGDVVAVTGPGKVFASLVAISGVAMVALPSAILASGFIRQLRLHSHGIRSKSVASEVQRLDLSEEDAARLVGAVLREVALQVCPNCGEPLDHIQRGPTSFVS